MSLETYLPEKVPVGRLELADSREFSMMKFCDTCQKRDTSFCYMCGKYASHAANHAYVSGAFPWDCIYCRYANGKPIKGFERDTYDDCPYCSTTSSNAAENAKIKKWGCRCLDLDGKHGEFCQAAVRKIYLTHRGKCRFPHACEHYEWLTNADHAHALWDKIGEIYHPMSFKSVRDYAAERKFETLYDLLLAFDSKEFGDFCKARKYTTVKRALDIIDKYAQVYGWFRIGDDKQWRYRKGAPFEQNIRVAKTVAAVANAEARKKAKKQEEKDTKEGGEK